MKKATTPAPASKPYADSVNIDKLPRLKTSLLTQRVHDTVLAFEAWQTKLTGRKHVAVRTRKALVAKGVPKTIADACTVRPSPGFRAMVDAKKANMTYEWIALEFPKNFSKEVLASARKHLDFFGVKGYPGWEKPEKKAKPKANYKELVPPRPPAVETVPEKRPRGWNLKGRGKNKAALATADAAE